MEIIEEPANRSTYANQLVEKLYKSVINDLLKNHMSSYCPTEWHTNYTIIAMLAKRLHEEGFDITIETREDSSSKIYRVKVKWNLPESKEDYERVVREQEYLDAYHTQKTNILNKLKDKYNIDDSIISEIDQELFAGIRPRLMK